MKPIAPLMIEHRVIERMLALFGREHRKISRTGAVDRAFLGTSLDFFRTYVDLFHHGKEEDILFREVARKQLSPEDRSSMKELIAEHERSRLVLDTLGRSVESGNLSSETAQAIAADMEKMLAWYPAHIEKEDQIFFPAAMRYLSSAEQAAMLEAAAEFDRNFTQQRYVKIIEDLEEYGRKAA